MNRRMILLVILDGNYSQRLKERAEWLCLTFDKLTDGQVTDLIENNLGKWGTEFTPTRDEVDEDV